MRIQLRDLTTYWKKWAWQESEGDPFYFYPDGEETGKKKGKGRLVEENEQGERQEDEKGEEEEEEEEDEEGEEAHLSATFSP